MSGIRTVLAALFRRSRFENDMNEELRDHIARRAEDLVNSGCSAEEAQRRARLEFGTLETYKDDCRQARGVRWLDEIRADIAYGLRSLGGAPAFTLIAVLSLAIAIGANSAIFSAIDTIWLRPMPVPHSSQIVRVYSTTPQDPDGGFSYPEYQEIAKQARSFSGVVAIEGRGSMMPRADGTMELLLVNIVSTNFFRVLGVNAAVGRLFGPEDDADLWKHPGVVLGHSFWMRRFGGDAGIVGLQIRLSRGNRMGLYTVLGVLPRNFREINPANDRDLWMPPQTWVQAAGDDISPPENRWFHVLARLGRGASVQPAQAEMSTIARRLAAEFPASNKGRGARVISDFDYRMKAAGTFGYALFGVVGMVLLLAAVNVANLLLARGAARTRELSTRIAIGAGRARIARQLLAENVLLGAFGLIAGLAVGMGLIRLMPMLVIAPPGFRMPLSFDFDSRVMLVGVIVALATTVLFGVLPALRVSGVSPIIAMRGGDVQAASGRSRFRLRQSLVIAQVSISVAVLATAGVLVESFLNTRTGDLGLTRDPRLVVWMSGSDSLRKPAIDLVRNLPGVGDVAVAIRAPLSLSGNGISQQISFPDRPERPNQPPKEVLYNAVSANYFHVMGVPLLRGRAFEESDETTGAPVVIVNETMAERYWPGQDPIGKIINIGEKREPHRVIGVAHNSPVNEIGEVPDSYLYLPFWRTTFGEYTLLADTGQRDAAALIDTARRTLFQYDHRLDPMGVTTQGDLIRFSASTYQITAALVSALGAIALLLTAVGLYGVVSWRVAQRTREIGIRMAIGADPRETIRLILREAGGMGLLGLLVGAPLALMATRLASSALFGVTPWEPRALFGATLVLAMTLLLAAFVPARRATRVDPLTALRNE